MYDKLYDHWKREKLDSNLQSIEREFYEELARYMNQLRDYLRSIDEQSAESRLAEAEFQRAERLSREVIEMRVRKILRIVESKPSIEVVSKAVVGDEKFIFDSALETSKMYNSILEKVLASEIEGQDATDMPTKPKNVTMVLVRFLVEVPAIVGADLRSYGPFKAEDMATIPLQNAEILVKGKAALRIACE
jgi:DNA replication factor GINS